MKNFMAKHKRTFGGGLLLAGSLVCIVLFQNCSENKFTSGEGASLSGSDVFDSVDPSLGEYDPSNPESSGSFTGTTAIGVIKEDIITPRLVFAATPNGPAQEFFQPGQTIYARAYGLKATKKENLKLYITQLGMNTCLRGGGDCVFGYVKSYVDKVFSTFSYNPANKTWNFQMKYAFDIARKVIIDDSTPESLSMDGHCRPGDNVVSNGWCSGRLIENTVVVRSPGAPRILATVEVQLNQNSDIYGTTLEFFDYKVWQKYSNTSERRFILTGVPPRANVIYCSEVAGSNACANKANWASRTDIYPYVALSQTYVIRPTFKENTYYCGNNMLTEPFNRTINMYAEDLNSNVKAQATFIYGEIIQGCQQAAQAANPGSGVGAFGPGR